MQSIRSLCATTPEISDGQKIQCVIIFWDVKNYNCSIQKSFLLNLFFFLYQAFEMIPGIVLERFRLIHSITQNSFKV